MSVYRVWKAGVYIPDNRFQLCGMYFCFNYVSWRRHIFKPHFFTHPAAHAFIDTQIIAAAPYRYLWAGIGDTYAKITKLRFLHAVKNCRIIRRSGSDFPKCAWHRCLNTADRHWRIIKGCCNRSTGAGSFSDCGYDSDCIHFPYKGLYTGLQQWSGTCLLLCADGVSGHWKEHLHGEVVGFGVLYALLVDGQQEEFEKFMR